jgi:dipeptide/tripeptide permease
MARLVEAVQAIAITFWVGSLWSTGLLVAPRLFSTLDDRTVAGTVAGRVFEATAVAGLICGVGILAILLFRQRRGAFRQTAFWLVVGMLAFTLVGQLGLQPVIAELREQAYPQEVMRSALSGSFAAWHAAAEVIYLVQCLLGAALVISVRTAGAGAART